jgi:hypothetical protein
MTKELSICPILQSPGFFAEFTLCEIGKILCRAAYRRQAQDDKRAPKVMVSLTVESSRDHRSAVNSNDEINRDYQLLLS